MDTIVEAPTYSAAGAAAAPIPAQTVEPPVDLTSREPEPEPCQVTEATKTLLQDVERVAVPIVTEAIHDTDKLAKELLPKILPTVEESLNEKFKNPEAIVNSFWGYVKRPGTSEYHRIELIILWLGMSALAIYAVSNRNQATSQQQQISDLREAAGHSSADIRGISEAIKDQIKYNSVTAKTQSQENAKLEKQQADSDRIVSLLRSKVTTDGAKANARIDRLRKAYQEMEARILTPDGKLRPAQGAVLSK